MEFMAFVAAVSAVCEFWHQVREPLLAFVQNVRL